jgi:hypothetical protein
LLFGLLLLVVLLLLPLLLMLLMCKLTYNPSWLLSATPVAMRRQKWARSNAGSGSDGDDGSSEGSGKRECTFTDVSWQCDGDEIDPRVSIEQTWRAMEKLVVPHKQLGKRNHNTRRERETK